MFKVGNTLLSKTLKAKMPFAAAKAASSKTLISQMPFAAMATQAAQQVQNTFKVSCFIRPGKSSLISLIPIGCGPFGQTN